MNQCPSRLLLGQYFAQEITDEKTRQEIAAHTKKCPSCAAALRELTHDAQEYQERQEQHWALLRARLNSSPSQTSASKLWNWRLLPALGLAAAAAIALLIVFYPPAQKLSSGPAVSDIQYKGTMSAQIIAQRGDKQFVVADGQQLEPNDALRFVLTLGAPGYIAALSRDAQKQISFFYPESSTTDEPLWLSQAGRHVLPDSIVLDNSLGRERIVIIYAAQKFSLAAVSARWKSLLTDEKRADKKISGADLGLTNATIFQIDIEKVAQKK